MMEMGRSKWTNLGQPEQTPWLYIYGAWFVSLVAMLASLFFSEVMQLPPCVLCWYQRIFIYPLVFILATGILAGDVRVTMYAWPLVIVGLLLAIYHNLLYIGVIPEAITPCTQGVSCAEQQIVWFGFITIPLLSLIGYGVIAAFIYLFAFTQKRT